MSLLFHEAQFHRQRGGPSATNHVYSSAAAGDELFVASRTNLAVLSPRSMGAYEPPKVSGATSSSTHCFAFFCAYACLFESSEVRLRAPDLRSADCLRRAPPI